MLTGYFIFVFFFFFNDTATTEIYTLSLHDALPIFLNLLFELLEHFHVRYCVLHAWESLPDELQSDLDISVHPADTYRLTIVFRDLKAAGFQPVQCLHYGFEAYRFVFCWEEDSEFRSLPVDVTFAHVHKGITAPCIEELIDQRQRYRNFWIAGPRSAFLYLLV